MNDLAMADKLMGSQPDPRTVGAAPQPTNTAATTTVGTGGALQQDVVEEVIFRLVIKKAVLGCALQLAELAVEVAGGLDQAQARQDLGLVVGMEAHVGHQV